MATSREWSIRDRYVCTDEPSDPRLGGSSIKWMCTSCGRNYASCEVVRDGSLGTFSFIHGCCLQCEGNRFYVPGSLECLTLTGWPEVPLPVLQYQLECEIRFLDHPHHPYNMEYPS